jgi:hypothetical protein
MAYALIQEGGSSQELYLHVHDTLEEAEADRLECADASYQTTDPIEMPDNSDWDAVETLLQSLGSLAIYEE